MRKIRLLTLGVLGAVALALMPAPQAGAATTAAAAFVGKATLTGGSLQSPVSPLSCGASLCPGDPGTGWELDILTGVAAGASTTPNPAGGTIDGTISGGTLNDGLANVGPWCGASGGSGGSGTMTVTQPAAGTTGVDTLNVTSANWAQSAGTLIVGLGAVDDDDADGAQDSTLFFAVSAVPPNPGTNGQGLTAGSCLDGDATGFLVVGAAAVVPASL